MKHSFSFQPFLPPRPHWLQSFSSAYWETPCRESSKLQALKTHQFWVQFHLHSHWHKQEATPLSLMESHWCGEEHREPLDSAHTVVFLRRYCFFVGRQSLLLYSAMNPEPAFPKNIPLNSKGCIPGKLWRGLFSLQTVIHPDGKDTESVCAARQMSCMPHTKYWKCTCHC